MKKLFLSAALLVAFSLTSFASEKKVAKFLEVKTEVKSNFELQDGLLGSCTIIVRAYNSDGELVGSRIHTFPAESSAECSKIGDQVMSLYEVGALTM
jgi:hypothetical protein